MARCSKCGEELSDTAKFCRRCGQQVARESPEVEDGPNEKDKPKVCPRCNSKVPSTAKFCRYCGYAFEKNEVTPPYSTPEDSVEVYKNFVTWRILNGQLAVRITEKDIDGYGKIKGIYITPGTKALFFVNGEYVAELDSGKYPFQDLPFEKPSEEENKVVRFFHSIAAHIKDGVQRLLKRGPYKYGGSFYSVMLIRGNEFPLIFDLPDTTTKNIRSNVVLHLLCEINNINLFFQRCLTDIKYVTFLQISNKLLPVVRTTINRAVMDISPEDIENNDTLVSEAKSALSARFAEVYPFFGIKQIIELSADRQELEKVRKLKEELYVADKELEQAQLRYDFLNKFENVQYENELRSCRSRVDFEALMDKVDEDHLLNADKKEQFVLMLEAEKALREAKTQIETQNAVDKLIESKMLSEEEIASLQRQIKHRGEMAEAEDSFSLAMATLRNTKELDKEKLNWELEIGNKRFENELSRLKKRDEYADERRNVDLEYQQKIREWQLETIRKLEEFDEKKEQASHQREIERKKLDYDAEIERHKINATMTFEQIMASNPNITPEAAAALTKKFEAEAATAAESKTADLINRHNEDIKEILARQMELTKSVVDAQAKANLSALDQKQSELDRVHADSEHHQDRMLAGMQTTVNAMRVTTEEQTIICPECGQKNKFDFKFCSGCGAKLR